MKFDPFCVCILLFAFLAFSEAAPSRPNILLIVTDDVGYSDYGYRGAEFSTPAMDSLAREGVILENFYAQPMCSPARSAMLTGTYPMRMGLQHLVIFQPQAVGVPLNYSLLPQELKKLGYKTHLVGKWHLGFYQPQYTPTKRGFDSHFGFLSADIGYFTYEMCRTTFCSPLNPCPPQMCGYDMYHNLRPALQNKEDKPYSPELFYREAKKVIKNHDPENPLFLMLAPSNAHTPLQPKQSYIDANCLQISNATRQAYCGMVTALDVLIKNVTDELKAKGLWENTLVFMVNDNGGDVFDPNAIESRYTYPNNYPFKGGKINVWEGGVRVNAVVSGPAVPACIRNTTNNGLFHVVDIYNTLIEAAGGIPKTSLDSIGAWNNIIQGTPSPREEVLINVDQMDGDSGALRYKNWKLVFGASNTSSIATRLPYVFSPAMIDAGLTNPCSTNITGDDKIIRLYDIVKDPSECTNVASENPEITFMLLEKYFTYLGEAEFPKFPFFDPDSNPDYFGGRWTPWQTNKGVPLVDIANGTKSEPQMSCSEEFSQLIEQTDFFINEGNS